MPARVSYTNHTLMHEALETRPVDMLGRALPRHLRMIFDINADFLADLTAAHGHDVELMRRMSLIDEHGERRVRMAYLAVVASHSVNGVSVLHSELMRQSIFADFARLWPERFNNKTNGVTRGAGSHRPSRPGRPARRTPGTGWRRNLHELAALREYQHKRDFLDAFRSAKRANKASGRLRRRTPRHRHRPGRAVRRRSSACTSTSASCSTCCTSSRATRRSSPSPMRTGCRARIFSGKAASAYVMAKQVIRLINDVAAVVNADARLRGRLKVVFIPNYSVSLAELIIPAADLSEQISTAGTEASGTGNMKLALNGAITIGTLDGANVEIREQVGDDNIFIFGHTTAEVADIRAQGYQPRSYYASNPQLAAALNAVRDGLFSPGERGRYQAVFDALMNWGDHYLLLADFASVEAQQRADALYRQPEAWTRSALLNVAGMGLFSSDRTIDAYAREIWKTTPIRLDAASVFE